MYVETLANASPKRCSFLPRRIHSFFFIRTLCFWWGSNFLKLSQFKPYFFLFFFLISCVLRLNFLKFFLKFFQIRALNLKKRVKIGLGAFRILFTSLCQLRFCLSKYGNIVKFHKYCVHYNIALRVYRLMKHYLILISITEVTIISFLDLNHKIMKLIPLPKVLVS